MAKLDSVMATIREHLKQLKPLTVVTLVDLYSLPSITVEQRHSVRAAIYGLCAGTPVSERSKPSIYYGVRLKLENGKQFILSLPGIPREDLLNDHESNTITCRIIERLQKKYGVETINYWGKSAQRRSVDQASKGMRKAKTRDNKSCLLCKHEGIEGKLVSACHIISRKTLFWKAIDEVEKVTGKLFTEEATQLLQKKLKDDELHSSSKYIVTLCNEHNKVLLSALKQTLSDQESDQESKQESFLWA